MIAFAVAGAICLAVSAYAPGVAARSQQTTPPQTTTQTTAPATTQTPPPAPPVPTPVAPVAPVAPVTPARTASYDDAVDRARRVLADLEQAGGGDDLRGAAAIDALVDALCVAGHGAEKETRTLAERALRIRTQLLGGPTETGRAASLSRLATVLRLSGDYGRSLALSRQAIVLHERAVPRDDVGLGRALDELGVGLRLTGDYKDAREALDRALAIRTSASGAGHVDVAATLEHLAAVELRQDQIARARTHLERALAIREQQQPGDPLLAGTYDAFGDLLWFEGDPARAAVWSARAVDLEERAFGPRHPDLSLYLRNLAATTGFLGDQAAARALLERAQAIATETLDPLHPELGWILNELAVNAVTQGDYLQARRQYEGALKIFETRFGPMHLRVATVLHNLALLRERLGDFDAAIRLERRALAIWRRQQGPDSVNVARAFSAMASMNANAGRDEAARLGYTRALAIREQRLGPRHRDVARTLGDLAPVLVRLGRSREAQARLSRAFDIWTQAGIANDVAFVRAVAMRGTLEAERGEIAQARATLEASLESHERMFGAANPEVARVRVTLAAVLADGGDATAALAEAIEAEEAGRSHLQLTMRDLSERLALGYAASRPKGLDLAVSIAATAPSLPSQDVSRVADELIRSRGVVLDEMAARNRAESGASPALSSPELTSRRAALAAARQRLANLVVRGPESLAPDRYAAIIEQARTRKEEAERALAETSVEFRKELARSHIGLAEVRAALPPGTIVVSFLRYDQRQPRAVAGASQPPGASPARAATAQGKRTRPPSDRSVPSYLAFVLRADAPDISVVPLGPARAIDASVARWRQEIGTGLMHPERTLAGAERAYRAAGAALRERIWDPLATHLGGAQRLFLVPDGALNLVSFASLPVGSSAFLVEQAPTIHYLSAERDVVRPDAAPRAGAGLLALGAPAFGSMPGQPAAATLLRASVVSNCASFASMQFPALPGTLREIEEVARVWNEFPDSGASGSTSASTGAGVGGSVAVSAPSGTARAGGVEVLSKRAASERAFKQRAPGHQVLHLATHGFFLGGPCRPAPAEGLRAVGGLAGRAASPPPVIDNPLMLSGLAFAGVNRRAHARADEDDGILTAEEVAGLDLEGVEWAVLSACDTGIGEIKTGEGVFGLRRSFQIAGVRTVILSLWAVEDRSAMHWMRALYDGRRRDHLDTAEAVRAATLAVLRDRRARGNSVHPFFWAGFVATGDWR
jgi:CHAT domain-containing protein/tetratricopeptide (TPR) repeat protein